ncbi:hypothetical protein B5M09_001861 [Aphanomyces astaci]|uniref:Sulfite exporter TauE/SafE n=1 Tax=Aphanomyces astaci TaxID=112090 RepID=A0A3R7Z3Q3_APHAT|nr:hypothetical protein B5M09_001861 [Aphanomyces astaci]
MEGQGHIRSVYEVGVITALFAIVSAALGPICGLSGGGLLVPPYMVVLGLPAGPAACLNKNVFSPFTGADVLAAFLAAFSTALGAACGLGGGGLLVPLYIVVVGLTPKFAIPLSKATILGGALATYWSNYHSKHPSATTTADSLNPPNHVAVETTGLHVNPPSTPLVEKDEANAADQGEGRVDTDFVRFRPEQEIAVQSSRTMRPTTSQETQLAVCHMQETNTFPFRQCILPLVVCIAAILAQSLLRGGHGAPSLGKISHPISTEYSP